MADVAAVAGVSHQTVSRVLNQADAVRPETRDRVLAAIDQLGYRRNETARTLATRTSRLIGVITADFVLYGPATTLLSIQLAAAERGYMVSVATLTEFSAQRLRQAIDQFLSQGVAGIIISAPVARIAEELERITVPVPSIAVASGWINPDSTIARIGVGQRVGVRQALEHLAATGCDEVAHFAGPPHWFDSEERAIQWNESMAELNLRFGGYDRGDWTAESGYVMAQRMLAGHLPEAIVIANDQMALGALRAFGEAGVRVGKDVRIVGYDDEAGTAFFYPSLTTVRQDFFRLGREAVQMLLAVIRGKAVGNILIPSELIVRDSA